MDWSGYEMREEPEFILSQESDIFGYRLTDYLSGILALGLCVDSLQEVKVNEKIRPLLKESSYRLVLGRPQILIFRLKKVIG